MSVDNAYGDIHEAQGQAEHHAHFARLYADRASESLEIGGQLAGLQAAVAQAHAAAATATMVASGCTMIQDLKR